MEPLFPIAEPDPETRLQILYDRLSSRFGFDPARVRLSRRKLTGGEIVYGPPHAIVISAHLSPGEQEDTLRHEAAHAWVWRLDGPLGKELADKSAEKGLIALGFWDNGIRQMTNSKRPIAKVEDLKGLKMRTPPDTVLVEIMQALGAEAQQIKFAELYVALQQGVVDGQENPLVNFHASKLYEVQKNLALTNHQFQMTPFLMSKRSWDKLSDADKAPVNAAVQKVKDAVAKNDLAAIKSATAELDTAATAMAQHVYAKAGGQPGAEPGPGPTAGGKDGGDDVMDAEYEVKK